jgi:uncharacterized Zn finger protein (UPF0148 family)
MLYLYYQSSKGENMTFAICEKCWKPTQQPKLGNDGKTLCPTCKDNEEAEEFEIKTGKADNLGYEIKYYEGKDVYYSDSVQALIEYAEKLEKLVLDKGL